MFTNDHDRNISMQQSLHAMTLDDCEATQGLTRNQRTPALGEVQQQKGAALSIFCIHLLIFDVE